MQGVITRGNVIEMPAVYLLNKDGASYCARENVPLRDMRDLDGERGVGFEWKRCRADALERLVRGRLLSRIEVRRPDFISARPQIILMTQAILDGLVSSRFNYELKRELVSRPEIARSLSRPPLAKVFASKASIASALVSRRASIALVVTALSSDCASLAAGEGVFDEPEEGLGRCASLIGSIAPESLLLAALIGDEARSVLARSVVECAGRMELAGELSLFLMEFIQVAEKAYLQSMAEYDRYARSHPEELQRLLSDAAFRERLFDLATRRGESMALRVSFPSVPGDRGVPRCLEIAVRTKGLVDCADASRELERDSRRREKAVRRMDLSTLLHGVARDDGYAELSLAYHARLEEACASRGMAFSSSVALDGMKNETTVVMGVDVHAGASPLSEARDRSDARAQVV